MNKTVPFLLFALVTSIVIVWYRASTPSATSRAATDTLIVGTNAEYFPFSFMENGTIKGFDIDLINEVAVRLNKKIDLRDMQFDSLIPALQIGTVQIIAAGISPTPERAKRLLFTNPYLSGDPLMIVSPTAKQLDTLAQLKGKKVGVNEGFTADYYMAKQTGVELVRFASVVELFMALESGQVDALVGAQNSIKPFMDRKNSANTFAVAMIPDTSDEYALAISMHYPELLEPVQKIIDDMMADGTLAQLKEKWKLA